MIARALESLERQHVKVTPDKVDSAWATEVQNRIDEIEGANVELLDVDESHAQLRAELIARRQ